MISKEGITQSLASNKRKETPLQEFPGYRRAAVLIPLFPSSDGLSILLTVRTHEVETHKGQISFPGGMRDESDRDAIHTALRETDEELAISQNSVEILGVLDDHATPTNFIVTPVAGYMRERPVCVPNPKEVEQVLEVPLSFFMDTKNGRTEERELRGQQVAVWHFQYGTHDIWGATAAMIMNFLSAIGGKR